MKYLIVGMLTLVLHNAINNLQYTVACDKVVFLEASIDGTRVHLVGGTTLLVKESSEKIASECIL